MVILSQRRPNINNELSALLRIVRSHYHSDIKLHFSPSQDIISEFKLKVLRKTHGYYRFLFLVKIPILYPVEPLWAEPVIICKQMTSQFKADHFKSYKLRPLIDNILSFCYRYESLNTHSIVISFPSTQFHGNQNIASKVFILINKALAKLGPPGSMPRINSKRLFEKPEEREDIGFYNDMGVNIVNYINMYENFRNKIVKRKYLKSRPHEYVFKKKSMSNAKSTLTKDKNTFIPLEDRNITEINYCKLNFCHIKNLIASLLLIPEKVTNLNFEDDMTIELGENIQISLKMIHDSLIIRRADLNEYANASFPHFEAEPNNLRNMSSLSLLPLSSRQLISMEIHYSNIQLLLHKFIFYQHQSQMHFGSKKDREEIRMLLVCDKAVRIQALKCLKVLDQDESLVAEICDDLELDIINICCEQIIPHSHKENIKVAKIHTNIIYKAELTVKKCPPFSGDLPNDDQEDSICFTKNILQIKCSEILPELIQYPKKDSKLFEYFLDLNPYDTRHQILFDCIGLTQYVSPSKYEILASMDYNVNYFFLKENIHDSDSEFIVRLHKLTTENYLYTLVLEENQYYKELSKVNRDLWCMPKTSETTFHLVKSVYNIANMYLGKIKRQKLNSEEATKLNNANLPIRRCHFYKEFVESLALFGKSQ